MAEEKDQIKTAEAETADPTGQGEKQTTETETSPGGEAQISTEEEVEGKEEKMIPIPSQKWRETNQTIRTLKDEIETLKKEATVIPETAEYEDENQVVINNIAEAVATRLSPSLAPLVSLEREERDRIIKDIGNRPYAKDLTKEIAKNFTSAEMQSLPIRERMEKAYQLAIGQNFDRLGENIATHAGDEGYNTAYNKIAEKQSAETLKSGAKTTEGGELTPDDIRDMTPSEYEKKRGEIFRSVGLGAPGR